MNMVITLLEIKPDEPSLSMWVPPQLRRVRPSPASFAGMAMNPRARSGVFGVVGLANEVSWALALVVDFALALASGVALMFAVPRLKGVAPALVMCAATKMNLMSLQWTQRVLTSRQSLEQHHIIK